MQTLHNALLQNCMCSSIQSCLKPSDELAVAPVTYNSIDEVITNATLQDQVPAQVAETPSSCIQHTKLLQMHRAGHNSRVANLLLASDDTILFAQELQLLLKLPVKKPLLGLIDDDLRTRRVSLSTA